MDALIGCLVLGTKEIGTWRVCKISFRHSGRNLCRCSRNLLLNHIDMGFLLKRMARVHKRCFLILPSLGFGASWQHTWLCSWAYYWFILCFLLKINDSSIGNRLWLSPGVNYCCLINHDIVCGFVQCRYRGNCRRTHLWTPKPEH